MGIMLQTGFGYRLEQMRLEQRLVPVAQAVVQ